MTGLGVSLAVLTLTPYDNWRQSHAHHHASSGDLDRRGIGDITTLTVKEYLALDRWGRLKYHLYRHPVVMFGFGPTYLFVFRNRFPDRTTNSDDWISAMATNIAIGVLVSLMVAWLGWSHFLAIHGPITLIAASIGVWLFYVQHQFEDTLWVDKSYSIKRPPLCEAVRTISFPNLLRGSQPPTSGSTIFIISRAEFHSTGCPRCSGNGEILT